MNATLLLVMGLIVIGQADAKKVPEPAAVRLAVERGILPIVKSMTEYQEHRDCFSCHHQAVPVFALTTARERGFFFDPDTINNAVDYTETDLTSAIESYAKGTGQGGGVTRAGYALLTFELGGKKSDKVTDAVAGYLLTKDVDLDHWQGSSKRPPSEASEFTATYLALRALHAYAKDEDKERTAARFLKVRTWLESAKPKDTEDRVFQLLALKQARSSEQSIKIATEALLTRKREDGGWSQLDDGKSDAYATGSALVALYIAGGLSTDSSAYRSGLRFLIGDQRKDGTWFVASRSRPFQPYFESGFPYGKDQFISMAASSWSVTALALACPKN